jgi:4-hydroxy-4-methyl-2-oxoglutarate aldolase
MSLLINDGPETLMSEADIAQWRAIPVAVISDELNRGGTMVAAINPVGEGMGFAAQALTARSMVGDNATLHYAIASAWPGCVIVVDARGHHDTAVWGGILTHAAQVKGVAAVVVDGAVRDVDELKASGMAVYARAVVPNGPHKGFGGSVNEPIQCAGVPVSPGDLLVGDSDGVVIIRPDQMDGLMDRCQARIAKEEAIVKKLDAGMESYEIQRLPAPGDFGISLG